MSRFNNQIWFWQEILSPHMGHLAAELANLGHDVIFVANQILSKERSKQGWERAELGKAKLKLAKNKKTYEQLAKKAPTNSIHFCQGLRGNGLIINAQRILRERNLKHWAMLEKIDDRGLIGKLRRLLYHIIFLYWHNHLNGVLAFGDGTRDWIIKRGMKKNKVFSFAYFLKETKMIKIPKNSKKKNNSRFRFIYTGQLIKRKNLDLLIKALALLKNKKIELWIVGDGPQKKFLKALANSLLPDQVYWFGRLPMSKVPVQINQVDCLVLPSHHDGWGAATSEALMMGTPVICSDNCGSSIVVKTSKVGGVFSSNNILSLAAILKKQYKSGKLSVNERNKIAKWARCLGAMAGAKYLDLILTSRDKNFIIEPWKKKFYEKKNSLFH
jgi:glycosyltransferase involved in cell wall biosynthesis